MKTYAKPLFEIKNDATKLQRLIYEMASRYTDTSNIVDLLANMYGWLNYDDMYRGYTIKRIRTSNRLLRDNGQSSLRRYSKDFVRHQASVVLLNKLIAMNIPHIVCSRIAELFFAVDDDHSAISKLLLGMQKLVIKKSPLPRQSLAYTEFSHWFGVNAVYGSELEEVSLLVNKLTNASALRNGGFFVLRESVADAVIDSLRSIDKKAIDEQLVVIDAQSSYWHGPFGEHPGSAYNPLVSDLDHLDSYLLANLDYEAGSLDEQMVSHFRKIVFLMCSYWRKLRDINALSLQGIGLTHSHIQQAIKTLSENPEMETTGLKTGLLQSLQDWLFYAKAFSIKPGDRRSTTDGNPDDFLFYFESSMHSAQNILTKLIDDAKRLADTEPMNSIEKSIQDDKIIVVKINNNDHESDRVIRSILSVFKSCYSKYLGMNMMVDNVEDDDTLLRHHNSYCYAMVADVYDRYNLEGFGYFAAQGRSVGSATFFVYEMSKPDISVTANAINTLMCKSADPAYWSGNQFFNTTDVQLMANEYLQGSRWNSEGQTILS